MLKDRFDFIVGNPPWLSYRYIADPEYQTEVKRRAISEYAIAPSSQKLFTQMELATIFLVHTLRAFGRVGCRLGFVLPRSVLSADQHENLRNRTYKAPVEIDEYWDLLGVRPLFKVPACVVLATRNARNKSGTGPYHSLPAIEWSGKLPDRDIAWEEAANCLKRKRGTARLIYLGKRNALSTKNGSTSPNSPSLYAKTFRQGATIVPRNFYFVRVPDLDGEIDQDRVYWAETDPEQAEKAQAPYQDVVMRGQVEGRFIYETALSRHLLPFALLEPARVVLPLQNKSGVLEIWEAKKLREAGYREFATWMSEVEKIWAAKRKEKAGKQSAYQRLDYSKELTAQNVNRRHLVLYNAAGTNIAATYVDCMELGAPFVVEHKVYWATCANGEEADYLVAILNSNTVNERIKPFQSHGLMGERDIEKKVLDLPIPLFTSDPDHKRLAELGRRARVEVKTFLESNELPTSLANRRNVVRKSVSATLEEIDKIAGRILGM